MKQKIAIASILKPVDETRMYQKIGRSLNRAGYEVHIAGFKGHTKSNDIKLYPLFFFKRLSMQRLFAPMKIINWLRKIKPDLLIITTHELLWITYIYKSLYKVKVIYDIRENYYLNIRLTDAFPPVLRNVIAGYIRWKERMTIKKIDFCFLAEAGYKVEMSFLSDNLIVLENKTLVSPGKTNNLPSSLNNKKISILFTGTIAESTGIFECIQMAKKLHAHDDAVIFTIAGMCHLPEVYKKLKKEVDQYSWISLIGGNHPVAHPKILELISTHDAAFLYYPSVELVKNKMPTKLYEYLAHNIPILLQQHERWTAFAANYNAAIPVDPQNFDAAKIMDKLKNQSFYIKKPGKEVLWADEEDKLLQVVENLFKVDH